MISRVRDEKSASGEHSNTFRIQVGASGRAAIAQRLLEAEQPIAGHGRDRAVGSDPPHDSTADEEAAVWQRRDVAEFAARVSRGRSVSAEGQRA
ncbi:MAG TPA: hypothetical protein VMB91_09640 [Solirubrobacteraceae bacterium]|nr:hypothetical protein [Solirubrobacteraceae bacterium]